MGNPPVITPPPDGAIPDVRSTTAEKVGSGVGRLISSATSASVPDQPQSPLEQMMLKGHQQRLAEAQMHQRNAATAARLLIAGQDLDQPAGPDGKHPPLTDKQKADLQAQYNASKTAFMKIVGQDPAAKKQMAGPIAALDHHVNQAIQPPPGAAAAPGGAPAAAPAAPAASPTGITPPPAAGSAAGAGGAGQPPTPKAPSGSDSSGTSAFQPDAAIAPINNARLARQLDEEQAGQRDLQQYKAKEGILYDLKVKEDQAKADAVAKASAAKSANTRPVFGPATSVRNARLLATQGKQYLDADGNPIDLTSMPDTMGLKYVAQGGKHWYEEYSPNTKVLTVGKETYGISPMDVEALGGGAGTDLGAHDTPSTTATTDPATGQTTVSRRTPNVTGAIGRGGTAQAAPTGRSTRISPPPATSGAGKGSPAGSAATATSASDITDKEGTPQIVAGARQLMDGQDVNKLPAKTRELSAQLAAKHGWGQGLFTPKERLQLDESTHFLNKFAQSSSLSVLDNFSSSMKLSQVLEGSHEQGMVGRLGTTLASKNMTPQEQSFIRLYNQSVQTIAGLRNITSPGRATEAAIQRLLADLPNPKTTANAEDGRKRLALLNEEIRIAKETRSWNHLLGAGSGDTGTSAEPSAGQLSQAARDYLKSQGVPVP